ncbi:hypothetical protein N7491_011343 [Penicillium cf. griseofulvum]|nr:hypothetical protein N7491_011343 [Penicillium cf. griseofulvum]
MLYLPSANLDQHIIEDKLTSLACSNDTVTTGSEFYAQSKNELESADVLSADSNSLPTAL